jgi:predicted phosphodiesterase
MKTWQKWFLILGIIAVAIWIWAERPKKVEVVPAKVVKIALMADVHNDTGYLNKAINMAKLEGDELVVIAGDLTINGTKLEENKVKTVLDNGGMKYAAVPGNHDDYKKIWIFGEKYQTVTVDGVKLIMIDNSNWRGLGEAQWQWIPGAVNGCRQMVCLAVMHLPLNNPYTAHIMGEYSPEVATEAARLVKILKENNVRQIEAGHLHMATSYEIDGIRTDLVGAVSKERNVETPRFTQLTVTGDRIDRKVVEIE